MLEVLPIQTKIEQEAAAARCAVAYQADCMAYHALVDGELVGICQFCMDGEGGHIRTLATVTDTEISERDRLESLFVLGRATLNFIDLCGVHFALFEDENFADEGLVKSIGFSRDAGGRLTMNLEGFFTEPCKCGK